jgi:hypothetical protein
MPEALATKWMREGPHSGRMGPRIRSSMIVTKKSNAGGGGEEGRGTSKQASKQASKQTSNKQASARFFSFY